MNDRNKEVLDNKLGGGSPKSKPKMSKPQGKRQRKTRDVKNLEFKSSEPIRQHSCVRDGVENDPQWYAASEQLLEDAFSMSTPYALGSPLHFDQAVEDPTQSVPGNTSYYTAGILTIHVLPIPGISRDGYSPLNVAAGKLYQWVRHANAGSTNYNTADIMMYMLAMDNAYMLWNWMARAYGVMRTYNQTNLYMPKALVEAMGIDFDSIYPRLGDFRYLINQFGSEIGSYAVPAVMPYFTRHAWLFSNIYNDSPSFKAQLYVINPAALYTWVEAPESGQRGYLQPQEIGIKSTKLAFDAILELVQMTTNGLGSSEDFRIMSGDILKAYGLNNLLTVPEVTPETTVLPVYSEEVISQIQNCNGVRGLYKVGDSLDESVRITQNDNVEIVCDPIVNAPIALTHATRLPVNFTVDHPSASDVAVATRLLAMEDPTTYNMSERTIRLWTAGSEIPVLITVSRMTGSGVEETKINTAESSGTYPLRRLSCFHRHPLVKFYTSTGSSGNRVWSLSGIGGDVENLTVVDGHAKKKMDDTALLSLFDVPEVAFS